MISCTANVETAGLGSLLCHWDSAPNDLTGGKKKAEVENESKKLKRFGLLGAGNLGSGL